MGILLFCSLVFNATMCDAREISDEEEEALVKELQTTGGAILPIGQTNDDYENAFIGQSYRTNLSKDENLPLYNVTFAHGAHTVWHIHHNTCQVLIAVSGAGYYQIWGEKARKLLPGETVTIPADTKHWHGAAPYSSFQHIVHMLQGENISTEWLEPINDAEFNALQ